jgi:DNA-binding transcriptional MocR family regulator
LAADPRRAPLATGYLTLGLAEHRAAGAAWMARSVAPADADRVLVCGGAQQAMMLALSLLVEPGDAVLVDEVTYPGIKTLADLLRLQLVGVPGDAEGMAPDALAAAARRDRARVVYTLPNLHNPTGAVLGEERRAALVEVARRHGLSLIEDDTYGFLLADPPAPLAALAPERTWFVSSTSKALSPGLRIGYLAVPDAGAGTAALLDRVAAQVTAVGWMAAPLMGEIATRWIEGGAADRVVAAKRAEVAARRTVFARLFGAGASASHPTSCHLWLPLPEPWRGASFAARARERGVAVAPAEVFVSERARLPRAVRVAIGTPSTRAECEHGLARLAGLLAGAPTSLV